jgi:hypothetical protein
MLVRGVTLDVMSSLVMGDFQWPSEACLTDIVEAGSRRQRQISSTCGTAPHWDDLRRGVVETGYGTAHRGCLDTYMMAGQAWEIVARARTYFKRDVNPLNCH